MNHFQEFEQAGAAMVPAEREQREQQFKNEIRMANYRQEQAFSSLTTQVLEIAKNGDVIGARDNRYDMFEKPTQYTNRSHPDIELRVQLDIEPYNRSVMIKGLFSDGGYGEYPPVPMYRIAEDGTLFKAEYTKAIVVDSEAPVEPSEDNTPASQWTKLSEAGYAGVEVENDEAPSRSQERVVSPDMQWREISTVDPDYDHISIESADMINTIVDSVVENNLPAIEEQIQKLSQERAARGHNIEKAINEVVSQEMGGDPEDFTELQKLLESVVSLQKPTSPAEAIRYRQTFENIKEKLAPYGVDASDAEQIQGLATATSATVKEYKKLLKAREHAQKKSDDEEGLSELEQEFLNLSSSKV